MKGPKQSKQEPPRDEYGRIDVPVFPAGTTGNPTLDIVRLGMVGGQRSDTDPTVTPVSSINNFVMLPDGSGIRIRDGYEYNERYAVETDPPGRQAYMIESAPPGVGLGYRHMILNTVGTLPYISDAEYVRDRTQSLSLGQINSTVIPGASLNVVPPGGTPINGVFTRIGDLSYDAVINVKSFDGTAVAGVDYTTYNQDLTLTATIDNFPLDPGLDVDPAGIGKFFFLAVTSRTNGVLVQTNRDLIIVNIVAP